MSTEQNALRTVSGTITPGLLARAVGVIRRPRNTFSGLTAAPVWAGMLLASTGLAAAASALLYLTDVGQLALVDHWERAAIALGRDIGDAEYGELQRLSEAGPLYGAAIAVLNGPVLGLAATGLILAVFTNVKRPVTARQVFAVVVHAGVILALRQVVAAPVSYLRETTSSATALNVWVPGLGETSPVGRLLAMFDLFIVWWLVVVAIGVAVLYGRRARGLAAMFVGIYIGFAAFLAGLMALFGGTE